MPPVSEAASVAVTHQTRQPRAWATCAVARATVDLPSPPIPARTHVPAAPRLLGKRLVQLGQQHVPAPYLSREPASGTVTGSPLAPDVSVPSADIVGSVRVAL